MLLKMLKSNRICIEVELFRNSLQSSWRWCEFKQS